MPITIHNFMGRLGWNMRKYFPKLSSDTYLKLQFARRRRLQDRYIDYFMSSNEPPHPLVVNIETINRCNSTCAFCTANIHAEKRPLAKIDDDLYHSIIDQLADWGYKGHLTLYGNNEPLLDTRIVEFHKYAREKLPEAFIFMSTNGLILTLDTVKEIKQYVDQLIINNYCMDMKLHDNIKEIYDYVVAHPDEFEDVDILIQMRYLEEVLTNRAGSAPNKQSKGKVITETCLMPYTDMWIMPNGKMGICCCDNFEVTDLADVRKMGVAAGWNSEEYRKLREDLRGGRQNYQFCKHCDFIDAGLRMDAVLDELNHSETLHGARQSLSQKTAGRKKRK